MCMQQEKIPDEIFDLIRSAGGRSGVEGCFQAVDLKLGGSYRPSQRR